MQYVAKAVQEIVSLIETEYGTKHMFELDPQHKKKIEMAIFNVMETAFKEGQSISGGKKKISLGASYTYDGPSEKLIMKERK